MPADARRLLVCVGASLALHLATLTGIPPQGLASAPYRGAASPHPMYATLLPAQRPDIRVENTGTRATESPPTDAPLREAEVSPDARKGAPGGADVPFPDKWYTADELDVRAEPNGPVLLDYPEELDGSGIPGRVQVLLYIDERGIVRRMHVMASQPERLFDKAALRPWVNVQFSPATKNGVAVKSQKLIELDFQP